MNAFLDRLVSKALAATDDGAALRPRLDAGAPNAGVSYGDAIHVTNAAGEEELERIAQPGGAPPQSAGAPVPPPVQSPVERFRTPRPPIVGEGTAHVLRDAEGSPRPVLPAAATSLDATRAVEPAREAAPPRVDLIRESAPRHVTRRIVREREANVAPTVPMSSGLEREDTRLDAGSPIARRAAVAAIETEVTTPDRRQATARRHPSPVVPRASLDGDAWQEPAAAAPTWPTWKSVDPAGSRDASREQPALHVTIGRIEIRAPQPPPAAAPRHAHMPRERSLEDYLKTRASKGPR